MLIKPRSESKELLLFRTLHPRMKLTDEEKNHLYGLEKGYQGEVSFDQLIKSQVSSEHLLISDLMVKVNGSHYQMDSLMLLKVIKLFEIKNFEGDYYVEGDKWFTQTGIEISNPVAQLQRAKVGFSRLLKEFGSTIAIDGYVIFVNPQFTLYQAPRDLPIILPTQLPRFLHKLNRVRITIREVHRNLFEQLAHLHVTDPPFTQKPVYHFHTLAKGISCPVVQCGGFIRLNKDERSLSCTSCNHKELMDQAVVRSIREYRLLFPETAVTTNLIEEWCGEVVSKKTVRRVLKREYQGIGHGKSFQFIDK